MKAKPRFTEPASFPAVLTEEEAAQRMGMKTSWFEVLARKGHVHCLGGYQQGCPRYYASVYIASLKEDLEWLDEAFKVLREDNKEKNSGKSDSKEAAL